MGLYPWQYMTKPPFQFSGISIRNLAPLISPISTLGSPFGAAAQKVVHAKSAMISLIVEPPGIYWKYSREGARSPNSGARMSRQSEKFLIGQSRKFLLTAVRLK